MPSRTPSAISFIGWRNRCQNERSDLTHAIDQRVQSTAKLRGYSTPTAFVRAAIKKELDELGAGSAPNEQILGYIREVRQDVRRVERAQQALFALVDSFAKVFVTCVPEPRGEAMQTALGEARTAAPACSQMRATRCSVTRCWRWRT
jgi:hypothetical protein